MVKDLPAVINRTKVISWTAVSIRLDFIRNVQLHGLFDFSDGTKFAVSDLSVVIEMSVVDLADIIGLPAAFGLPVIVNRIDTVLV